MMTVFGLDIPKFESLLQTKYDLVSTDDRKVIGQLRFETRHVIIRFGEIQNHSKSRIEV